MCEDFPYKCLVAELRNKVVLVRKAVSYSIICFPMCVEFSPVNLLMNHLLVYFPHFLMNSLNSSVPMFIREGCSEGQNTSHWALTISIFPLPLGSKSGQWSVSERFASVFIFLR